MLIDFITREFNHDHLVKIVFAEFLLKLLISPCVTSMCLRVRFFVTAIILLLKSLPSSSFSMLRNLT